MDPKLLEVLTAANSAQYAPLVPGLLVLAEDGLPHEDATTGEESVREDVVVNATRTLVVFDFDCTITSVHLFHTLHGGADGGSAANEELRADPAAFYTRICGGEARVALLRVFLQGLRAAGATLRYTHRLRRRVVRVGRGRCAGDPRAADCRVGVGVHTN